MRNVLLATATIMVLFALTACGGDGGDEPVSLFDLTERACKEMFVVSGSDDWNTYNQVEQYANRAGFTTSQFDDALRELCQDIFSEYVNSQPYR